MNIAFQRRLIAVAAISAVAVLFAACGGGGASDTSDTAQPPLASDPSADLPVTVLPQATSAEEIDRLRGLGYQVFPVSGDTAPDTADDAPDLQLLDVAPPDSSASAAAASGRAQIQSVGRVRPMVVGGNYASAGQFNFTVFVSSSVGSCTGSIIGPSWIKTAGHCIPTTAGAAITASIGSVMRGFGVEHINSDYYVRMNNDTALVHLVSPTSFPSIAYNADPAFDQVGPVISLGFGQISDGGPTANLKYVENTAVSPYFPGSIAIGSAGSMQTICRGDSGGPNIKFNADGYPVDIATTSATFAPYCTGIALAYTTSALAVDIQRITGIPAGAFPTTNRPPVIQSIPSVETAMGPTSVGITATDPEGDRLVYSAVGLPAGLSINQSTGVISGTTTAFTNLTPSIVTVTVTDSATSAKRTITFPWRVNTPGNVNPVLQDVPSQQTRAGTPASLTVAATDPNGDAVVLTATGLPPGLSISPSGAITGTPTRGGVFAVNLVANDQRGGMALSSFQWTILNTAPSIATIPDQTLATGGVFSLPISASDPDGDPLTITATGLPRGLQIVPGSNTITGTTNLTGVYLVSLLAEDAYGGTAARTFTLAVSTAFNKPPTMTELQPRTDLPGVAIPEIALNPFDPDGQKMTLSFKGLPVGIVYDPTRKVLRGTPVRGGVFTVEYSIFDAFGGKTTYTPVVWTIPNTPPALTPPADATILPGVAASLPFSASDPDGQTFVVTAAGLPRGLVVNNTTKQITGAPLLSGTFTVTLTATDKYLAKTVATFTITVPNQAPVIGSALSDMTTVVGTPLSIPLDISDPEGHRLVLSVAGPTVLATPSSLPTGLVLNPTTKMITGTPIRGGTFTVTIKVADVYGAASHMPTFVWTIVNTKPTALPLPAQTVTRGVPATIQLAATDPEGNPVTFGAVGLPTGLRLAAATGVISGTPSAVAGTYNIAYYARDKYGLTSNTVTSTITVN